MRAWSILLPNLDDLRRFLPDGGGTAFAVRADEWFDPPFIPRDGGGVKRLLADRLTRDALERVYFGVEFCHRLIPDPEPLREAFRRTRDAGLAFSFVTPPVTDPGIDTLRARIALLREEAPDDDDIEVIVNDWGVLRLLKERFPGIVPVFGRMMNKMIRDPRVTPFYDSRNAPREGLRAVRESSVSNPAYRAVLGKWGVSRFEFDNVHQGIALGGEGISVSVYIPYGYVATGRMCMPGSMHLPREEKFTEYIGCRRECQEYTHELDSELPATRMAMRLIQRGNTIFFPNSRPMLDAVFSDEGPGRADRVVYQPGLPI
jgi:hypothetical protein